MKLKLVILFALLCLKSNAQSQSLPPYISNIKDVISYSKMRPMAMVSFLTINNNWKKDSDYYYDVGNYHKRRVLLRYNEFELQTDFDDEMDILVFRTGNDQSFYYNTLSYFRDIGLHSKGNNIVGNYHAEIFDNTTDVTNGLMILINTVYQYEQIQKYEYHIIIHPS